MFISYNAHKLNDAGEKTNVMQRVEFHFGGNPTITESVAQQVTTIESKPVTTDKSVNVTVNIPKTENTEKSQVPVVAETAQKKRLLDDQ